MIQIDMEMPKDCRKCPFMATDGLDVLSPMMCVVMWGKNHEKRYCIQGKVRDDCPLKEVPSGKWIPISEKLPEESGYYLVSGKGKVWICEMLNLMGIKGWSNNASNPIVEAWQPLPKPYEVEEQTGENTDGEK